MVRRAAAARHDVGVAIPDDPDLREAVRRELLLHRPAVRRDPGAVRALLHPRFREVGASGRTWDLDGIVATLAEAPGEAAIEALDVAAEPVGPDAVLVTSRARTPSRESLRSSLWVREGDEWRLLFHQGTPVG